MLMGHLTNPYENSQTLKAYVLDGQCVMCSIVPQDETYPTRNEFCHDCLPNGSARMDVFKVHAPNDSKPSKNYIWAHLFFTTDSMWVLVVTDDGAYKHAVCGVLGEPITDNDLNGTGLKKGDLPLELLDPNVRTLSTFVDLIFEKHEGDILPEGWTKICGGEVPGNEYGLCEFVFVFHPKIGVWSLVATVSRENGAKSWEEMWSADTPTNLFDQIFVLDPEDDETGNHIRKVIASEYDEKEEHFEKFLAGLGEVPAIPKKWSMFEVSQK